MSQELNHPYHFARQELSEENENWWSGPEATRLTNGMP